MSDNTRFKMPGENHFRKLERMYISAPCNEYYSPTISISKGCAEISIPIQKKFFHAAGAVHGSVYFKALDDAAFFSVNSLVEDLFVLTVNFNVYLIRPISEGKMTAIGKVIHTSNKVLTAESYLTDSKGRDIAHGSGLFMKSKIKLSGKMGYV